MKRELKAESCRPGHDSSADACRQEALCRAMEAVAAKFSYTAFSLLSIPGETRDAGEVSVVVTTLPAALSDTLKPWELDRQSPAVARLRVSTIPFAWSSDSGIQFAGPAGMIRRAFRDANLLGGAAIPVHDAHGKRAAAVFHGERPSPDHRGLADLAMAAATAYDRHHPTNDDTAGQYPRLSEREVEVLTWAANGKTSADIGQILGLSDHTVNSYLNGAMRKLDCVNRTQLVAKALRLGIIR